MPGYCRKDLGSVADSSVWGVRGVRAWRIMGLAANGGSKLPNSDIRISNPAKL